jgi:hypothetical protein
MPLDSPAIPLLLREEFGAGTRTARVLSAAFAVPSALASSWRVTESCGVRRKKVKIDAIMRA